MTASDAGGDDAELIARYVASRDGDAFRLLYRRHSPAVYGLLCRLTGGAEADAADLLQTAWTRAAAALAGFRGDAQFRTWLTGIALNCYRESRRAAAARRAADHDPIADDAIAARPATASQGLAVGQIVDALPPDFREVLVLHDVEGFTHDDIARALGIETGTSRSRLSRARQLFRAWWRDGLPR
jgi:RNA polymerase sigma-70 factor (ECF subfamily)